MFLKTFGVATALMLSASMALACPGKDGGCKDGQCKYKKNDIAAMLELDGERADQVRDVQQKHKAEVKAQRAENRAAMSALRENHKSELRGLLTPEELEKVEAAMAAKRSAYHKAHHGKDYHHGKDHHGKSHGGYHSDKDKE